MGDPVESQLTPPSIDLKSFRPSAAYNVAAEAPLLSMVSARTFLYPTGEFNDVHVWPFAMTTTANNQKSMLRKVFISVPFVELRVYGKLGSYVPNKVSSVSTIVGPSLRRR